MLPVKIDHFKLSFTSCATTTLFINQFLSSPLYFHEVACAIIFYHYPTEYLRRFTLNFGPFKLITHTV